MTIKDTNVTTHFELPGFVIQKTLGLVRGLVVRVPTISQGFMGGLKSIVGGQNSSYTDMCESTRQEAYQAMLQHAESMGANAIICVRYDSSALCGANNSGATEVLCYGTAAIVSEIH